MPLWLRGRQGAQSNTQPQRGNDGGDQVLWHGTSLDNSQDKIVLPVSFGYGHNCDAIAANVRWKVGGLGLAQRPVGDHLHLHLAVEHEADGKTERTGGS